MRYKFSDILEDNIYETANVVLVTGKYEVFNSMVSDTLKWKCMEGISLISESTMDEEFSVEKTEASYSNYADLATFLSVVATPNINGKWFTTVDYCTLSDKMKNKVKEYVRRPSGNGVMFIAVTEFVKGMDLVKMRVFDNSRSVHAMNLNYPNRNVLATIVVNMFGERAKYIEPKAVELLLMKVNKSYDKLEEIVEKVVEDTDKGDIEYTDVKQSLKGVENFDVSDFLVECSKPLANDKTNNKKIYRMLNALEFEYGPRTLANMMLKEINVMIEFRILINKGIIPIRINYFFSDVKKAMGEEHKFSKMNEYVFRKKATIAAQTSLKDWEYMMLIIDRAKNSFDEDKIERALYDLVTRSVMSPDRLNNIIGVDNIISRESKRIDKYKYIDRV